MRTAFIPALAALASLGATGQNTAPKPPSPVPPKGAIRLFDGKDLSEWQRRDGGTAATWDVMDGYVRVKPGAGDIVTRRKFGDCTLHVEFNLPLMPEATSQGRGNSGVYLHGKYEIQVLDSYMNLTYPNGGVGALYGQKDPDRNALRPPGVWQSYDIRYRAPRTNSAGNVLERPRITVFHNGILIHDDVEIKDTTTSGMAGRMEPTGPILLQDHGNRVKYRNIWVVPGKA